MLTMPHEEYGKADRRVFVLCVCVRACVHVCSSCNCSTVAMRRKLTASILASIVTFSWI